ncbi:MAG: MarR family transcriptional regulator [Alphaproteobacteria bacterium]|nr:MarR family transcriptional regulator [Alphaproteobacteria bacterium]
MPQETLERNLGFLLHDVARLLRTRFEQKARGLGLTRAQWRALAHIERNPAINQARLAEILEVEPISLARLVDRLEKLGLVERRPHPTDRRMHTLHVARKSLPMIDKLHVLGAEAREEAMLGLAKADREALLEMLLHIKSNLSDRAERPEPAARAGRRQGADAHA